MQNGIPQTLQHLPILNKDDEKILTVESTGALNPEQIVLEGVQEVSRRVVEFKDMINNIEE